MLQLILAEVDSDVFSKLYWYPAISIVIPNTLSPTVKSPQSLSPSLEICILGRKPRAIS
jgi:hypothetical protein